MTVAELQALLSRAASVVEAARHNRAARSGGTRPQQVASAKALDAALDAYDAARAAKAAE